MFVFIYFSRFDKGFLSGILCLMKISLFVSFFRFCFLLLNESLICLIIYWSDKWILRWVCFVTVNEFDEDEIPQFEVSADESFCPPYMLYFLLVLSQACLWRKTVVVLYSGGNWILWNWRFIFIRPYYEHGVRILKRTCYSVMIKF